MNTPMNDDVSSTAVGKLFDKQVSGQLVDIDPEYWTEFVREDGMILCELNKLIV